MRGRLEEVVCWIQRHALGLSLLLGLVLRLIGLESRSLQYDDTFSIFLSARSLPEILSGTAADTMPPLYYFLLHFWMVLGQTAWFIRLLSVILSLAAIFLLYRLAERWLGVRAAGWTAFLAAISPLLIYHGQDVRMYALLVVFLLGYLWFFTGFWEGGQAGKIHWGDGAGLVLCGAAAMYTHNVAIFSLVVPNLFLLIRREWKQLGRLVAFQAVIGLLALPWLLLIPGQVAKVQKAWTLPKPGAAEIIQALIMFTSSLPLPFWLLAAALFFSVFILVVLGLELWRGRKSDHATWAGLVFWLVLLLLPPGLLLAASYVVKPIFIPRAFLVSSLAYDALGGWVIAKTWKGGAGKLLCGVFVLAALISLPVHYTYSEFPRSPYRQMVQYLQEAALPDDQIVHETKLSYFPARFYAPELAQVFLADRPGEANDTFEPGSQKAMDIHPQADLAAAAGDSHSVYFITFTQTFKEFEEMGLPEHPHIAWLEDHYRLAGRVVYRDLEIYHYER